MAVRTRRYGDLFDAECPSRTVLDIIGDKWTTIVVLLLADGPQRFNELARCAEGISFKMLTTTLRRLERDGFVSRHVEATRPPAVRYALTPLGDELLPLLDALRGWAESHVGAIVAQRRTFDRRLAR